MGPSEFLMHRVELKGMFIKSLYYVFTPVPNAPCGVERVSSVREEGLEKGVPNAPCGVERTYCLFFHQPNHRS